MIYFISDEKGSIKIGVASDIEKRLSSLQTGNPNPLKVKRLIRIKGVNDYEAERALHDHFKEYQLTGEWFKEDAVKDLLSMNDEEATTFIRDLNKRFLHGEVITWGKEEKTIGFYKGEVKRLEKFNTRLKSEISNKRALIKKHEETIKKLQHENSELKATIRAFYKMKGGD